MDVLVLEIVTATLEPPTTVITLLQHWQFLKVHVDHFRLAILGITELVVLTMITLAHHRMELVPEIVE